MRGSTFLTVHWCAKDTVTYVVMVHIQAALPFKSKPKVPGARKRPTLEQKRAVVLEPAERRTVALIDQLNALRNEKAAKKRAKQARQREVNTSLLPGSLRFTSSQEEAGQLWHASTYGMGV